MPVGPLVGLAADFPNHRARTHNPSGMTYGDELNYEWLGGRQYGHYNPSFHYKGISPLGSRFFASYIFLFQALPWPGTVSYKGCQITTGN